MKSSIKTARHSEDTEKLFRQQRQALNIPGKMLDSRRCGENNGASGSERQADQALSGHFKTRFSVGSDLHDAALSGHRRGYIQVAVDIEGDALRAAEPFVESGDGSVRIDLVHAVETGRCGAGHEQIAIRTECEVIGGDAGFERGEDED